MSDEIHISTALAKAQAAFEPIRRDKTVNVRMKSGGTYTFAYAPLESILQAVQPALSREGLAVTQSIVTAEAAEYVETTLSFGAQSLSGRVKIIVGETGPQAYGSALTYARRYGITLLLCVCADDDDDANAAEGNEATVKEPAHDPDALVGIGKHAKKKWREVSSDYLNWATENPCPQALKAGAQAEISRRLAEMTSGIEDEIPYESVSTS